jgi:hypothetical protein
VKFVAGFLVASLESDQSKPKKQQLRRFVRRLALAIGLAFTESLQGFTLKAKQSKAKHKVLHFLQLRPNTVKIYIWALLL